MSEERWDDDRANRLLDAALVVLTAAGGWEAPEDGDHDDPARLLRFAELYFSEDVRQKICPHVDRMNRGIGTANLEACASGSWASCGSCCAPRRARRPKVRYHTTSSQEVRVSAQRPLFLQENLLLLWTAALKVAYS